MGRSRRGRRVVGSMATRLARNRPGSLSRSVLGQSSSTLLEGPPVPIGVVEEGERVPTSALPVEPLAVLEMPDGADVEAACRELGVRGLDVLDDELQSLDGAGGRL